MITKSAIAMEAILSIWKRGTTAIRWLSLLMLLSCFAAPSAQAGLISSMSEEQFLSYNGRLGGSSSCVINGAYDASTFIWTQSGGCGPTALSIGNSSYLDVFTQASLAALVDNSGNLLGGVFALFGRIPGLGINTDTLLATGNVIDAFYGRAPNTGSIGQIQALIEFDYIAAPLHDLGTVMYWQPNAQIRDWGAPRDYSAAWTVSTEYFPSSRFTGTQYFFYDRSVFLVPEPTTLALLALSLAGLGFVRRKRA